MTATEGIVVLIGRVLFALFFIRSGMAHVRKPEGMKGYACLLYTSPSPRD